MRIHHVSLNPAHPISGKTRPPTVNVPPLGKPNAFFTCLKKTKGTLALFGRRAPRPMHKPAQLSTKNSQCALPANSVAGVLPDAVPRQRECAIPLQEQPSIGYLPIPAQDDTPASHRHGTAWPARNRLQRYATRCGMLRSHWRLARADATLCNAMQRRKPSAAASPPKNQKPGWADPAGLRTT